MKKTVKKALAALLAAAVVFQAMPITQLGGMVKDAHAESDALKEELAARAADYPEGAFAFYSTASETKEGNSDITVKVVRLGDTSGTASVDVKAADITAKYGEDFTAYVKDGADKLPFELKDEDKTAVQAADEATDTKETEEAQESGGLRAAYTQQTGEETVSTNWRGELIDYAAREMSVQAENEIINAVDGACFTLDFEAGEFEKNVFIHIEDDGKAESEENFALLLGNSSTGRLGEQMQYNVTVSDNEQPQDVMFEMKDSDITISEGGTAVTVTIVRTQGLDYYAGAVLQTVADTALPQEDYEPLDGVEIAFMPGETEKSVEIPILGGVGENKKFSVKITGCNTQQGKDTTDIYFGSKILAPLETANVQTQGIMENIQVPIAFADKPMTIASVETVSGVKYDVYPVDISNNTLKAYKHSKSNLNETSYSANTYYNLAHAAKVKIYTKLSGYSKNCLIKYYSKNGTLYIDGSQKVYHEVPDKKKYETTTYTDMVDVTYRQSTIHSYFQTKANTDGLCRTAQFEMTRYDSYVPYYTITLQNVNPTITAYDYTAPNKKTSRGVSALSKVSLKEGTKKELSYKAGSVNLTPGQTISGVSLTGFDVYVGNQKIGSINSTGVINYADVSKLREKYDSVIRTAKYQLTFKPVYSVAKSKVTFDSQDQSAIGFGNYKTGSGNAMTVQQIDTITITASRVGTQEFSPQSIKLFKVEKGRETQLESKANTKDQKTGAYPTSMTYKFTASQPEMLVRTYLTEPTLTVRYDPDNATAANSGVGMVLLAALNDPTNYIGVSAVGAPLQLPDEEHMYGFAGLNNSYVLRSAINDAYIHMENTAGGITTYSTTVTRWTYRNQNDGGKYKTVTGDSFAFKPYYADTVIDYYFKFEQEPEHPEGISGKVTLQEVPLFTSYTKPQTFPAVGVQITAGNDTVYTDKDGNYTIEPQFEAGSTVGAFMKLDTLTRADTIAVSKNTQKDMTIVVNDDDPLKIISSEMTVLQKQYAKNMNNEDVYIETPTSVMTLEDAVYHLKMTASGRAGVVPGKAEVVVYDKDGMLRNDIKISGQFGDDYTVDIPVDPVRDGLQVGDTIAIKLYDKNGVGYFERHTRLIVAEKLSGMYMFNYPAYEQEGDNALMKALGNISIGYDFVIDSMAHDHGAFENETDGKVHNMMFLGLGDKKDSSSAEVYKQEQEIINNFGNLKNGTYGGLSDKISVFGHDNGAFSLSIQAGAVMDCVLQENGKYVFSDFVLVGQAAGHLYNEWKVPIGPVTLAFSIDVTSADENRDKATGIRWHFYNASDTPFYITENSTLDLMTRKEIKSEGDLTLYMSATGDINAGLLGGAVSAGGTLTVTLDHHSLYSTDEGWTNTGYVSLAPKVYLHILVAKIPVWKDEWTYYYGDSNAAKSISMQMEAQADNAILFAPTAISSISEFEQAQETEFETSPTALADEDNRALALSVLKDSVAENADVKMQDIGGGKYLTVFIDAVPGRTAENALGAYYTVFDGEKWSTPELLEDDGTIDQLPTICNAGSKGWLIAWSDASRRLEKDEALTSSLNALDLTGRFYDAETDTLGEVMALTHETKEDKAADTSPQIVYYKDGGKEYMRLYYTKSEFEISDPDEGEVVGDILNPYQLIAVRNYDFAEDKWSEEYSGTAKDEILENVGELQYAQYVENWYGQEFLQLAPTVEMTEELDENGYWIDGTQPTFTEKDMSQTVVKGGDSIAYNHLSLFAYALDKGGMAQQTGDMNLYMQIYNMKDDEYHHPIQITSKNAEISDIRFERLKTANGSEMTYLYWLEDGVVKRINITDLVANDHLIKTEAAGIEYYYIDKSYTEDTEEDSVTDENYEPECIVASAYREESADEEPQELSITSYKVKQKDGRNYIVWTQFVPNGDGELQLFAAMEDLVNGEISLPVQLTDEKDLYINKFDCAVADDGSLDVTAVCQELDENGEPKADSAQLKMMHIVPAEAPQLVSAELDDVVIGEDGSEAAEFVIHAANKGLSSKGDLSIEIRDANGNVTSTTLAPIVTYDTTETLQDDGSVTLSETEVVTDARSVTLAGGESFIAKLSLPLNEDGSYKGTVRLLSGNTVIDTIELGGKAEAELVTADLTAEIESRGKVTLTANISNDSMIDSGEQNIVYGYIDENGERVQLGSKKLSSLAYGESSEITVTADIDFDKFESVVNEDGSITDSMTFYMDTDTENSTGAYTTLELYATAEEASFMKSLKELSAEPCEIGTDGSITLAKDVNIGDVLDMQLLIGGEIAANNEEYVNRTKIVWVSVDGEAVTLDENGIPVAAANGKATLKGFAVPYDMVSMMYADGITDNINNYDVKPSAVLIPIEATVTVGKQAQISGGTDDKEEEKHDNTGSTEKPGAQGSTNSPATGERTSAAVAILSAAALAAVMFSRKRNGKGGEE